MISALIIALSLLVAERPVVVPEIAPIDAEHSVSTRIRDGIPSIAVSSRGTMWATWYSSRTTKEDETNYVLLASSTDGREKCAYPDGQQLPDGRIVVISDYNTTFWAAGLTATGENKFLCLKSK